MFNKYYLGGDTTNVRCEVNLHTPSTGFIQKSNPVSRFIRFQRGSELEKKLFPTDPREAPHLEYTVSHVNKNWDYHPWTPSEYNETKMEEVVILQICIFGDDYMLAEYVFKKDLEPEKE